MSEAVPLEYEKPAELPPPKGALAIVLFIVFLDLMGFGIILPQLPFYAIRYHVSAVQVTLLFSIYSICQFIAAPLLGLVSDKYGRRPVLVFSQCGSALGHVLLGLVTQFEIANIAVAISLVYLARIIDGLSGGNISTAQAYISDVTTPATRARGMGLFGAAFGIGFSVGPAIGGLIGNDTTRAAWPAYAAALFSLTAMTLLALRLPESRSHRPVGEEIWLHPTRLGKFLRRSTLMQLLLISFVAMSAFAMLEGIMALYLNAKFTYGPQHTPYGMRQVGWYFGYIGFFIVVVQGGLLGPLVKRFGEWRLTICGALLVCLGMSAYVATGRSPIVPLLLLAGALNAVGRSLQTPSLSSLISKNSERSEQGAVFGIYHGLSSLARGIGPLLAGLLFEHVAFTAPFAVSGAITFLVAVWLYALRQWQGETGVALAPATPAA